MAVNIEITVLWNVMLCYLIDWYYRRETCCLPFQVFTLKMKTTCSLETLVLFYQIIWHHIPEDCHCDLREIKQAHYTLSDYDVGQGKGKVTLC
jgi:hypothetical protein